MTSTAATDNAPSDQAVYVNRLLMLQEVAVGFSRLGPDELIAQARHRVPWLFTGGTLHEFGPDDLPTLPPARRGRDHVEGLGEVYLAFHGGPPRPLYLALSGPDLSDANEFRFASLFFEHLLTALTCAGNRQVLELEAVTDPLTGLRNYRSFERTASRPEASGRRLAMLCLSDLHRINAREGWLAGDLVLRRVGEALSGLSPEASTTFRISGDTFALLVQPQRADAVRAELEALPFDTEVVWQEPGDPSGLELLQILSRRLAARRVPEDDAAPRRRDPAPVAVRCGVAHVQETLQEAASRWPIERPVELIADIPVGFALEAFARSEHPALVLTESRADGYLHDLRDAGPAGIIVGRVGKAQVIAGLQRVTDDETFYSGPDPEGFGLLPREREVWRLIAAGWSNDEIADRLDLKQKTVANYVTNLQDKLFLRGRTALALHYYGRLDRDV